MTDVDNGVPEVTDNYIYDMIYHIHLYVHDHFRLGDAGCDRRAAPAYAVRRVMPVDHQQVIHHRHDDPHHRDRERRGARQRSEKEQVRRSSQDDRGDEGERGDTPKSEQQRNLVYIGITRGKKLVVLIGQRKALIACALL